MKKSARHNLLETVPVRSEHIRTEWEGACAVLAYPRFKRAWMRRFFLPKGMSPDIHVRLEEHGTAVWKGDETYESRVAAYLMQLQRDGFIRFLSPLQHGG